MFRDFLADDDAHLRDFWEFLNPSHYIPFSERLQKLFWMARPAETEDIGIYVTRIVAWVRDQFDYQKARTHVHSSLDDILKAGGGVCQDFAHLTIGLLRLAGSPPATSRAIWLPRFRPRATRRSASRQAMRGSKPGCRVPDGPASIRLIDIAPTNAMSESRSDATMPTCRR